MPTQAIAENSMRCEACIFLVEKLQKATSFDPDYLCAEFARARRPVGARAGAHVEDNLAGRLASCVEGYTSLRVQLGTNQRATGRSPSRAPA